VCIGDVLRLAGLAKQLLQVTLADIGARVALVTRPVVAIVPQMELARGTNANMDIFQPAAKMPTGEYKTEMLIRRFGPDGRVLYRIAS
jgi:hypothetical protein